MRKNREQLSVRGHGLTRALNFFICVILAILLASCSDSDITTKTNPRPPGDDALTFLKAHYRVSHNSYSGNEDDGYRGGIIQQLDAGLRFVELDIHWKFDNDTVSFILGHSDPKQYVDLTHGNPNTYDAASWVAVVKDWVQKNQPREPVILAFDWKNEWNDDTPTAIQALHDFFPQEDITLYPKDFDPKDTPIFDYAGRVLVVLSGNEDVRSYYSQNYCFSDSTCSDTNAPPVAHMFVEYQDGNNQMLEGELFYARAFKGGCDWAKGFEGQHFTRLWLLTSPCEWTDASGGLNGPNLPATNFPYFGWYARYTHDLKVIPDFEFETIYWHQYDNPRKQKGSNPDVAVNNHGHVVEVHKSQSKDTLYYSIGNISGDGKSIVWDENYHDVYYTHGTTPSVAIVDHLNDSNELLLVEIHVDDENDPKLYYRFGLINTDNEGKLTGGIEWQGDNWTHYDNGAHPSVAINEDTMVLEVHEGSHNKLWYNAGGFDEQGNFSWGINWPDRNYNKEGIRPTVALHGNLIFEAHNSSDDVPRNFGYLWCRIGSLNADLKRIDWENPDSNNTDKTTYSYPIDQEGSLYPSVALYSNGSVEVHKDGDGIWWRMGKTSNSVMAVVPHRGYRASPSGRIIPRAPVGRRSP